MELNEFLLDVEQLFSQRNVQSIADKMNILESNILNDKEII